MKNDILKMRDYIQRTKSKEISSSSLFSADGTPSSDGLLSGQIFGVTPDDRRNMTGYIDLKSKFIHPLVYLRIFKRSYKEIDTIIKGSAKYIINNKGELERSDEAGAKTGLKFLYDNFDKLKFRNINNDLDDDDDELTIFKKDLRRVMKMGRDKIFIDKWIVIPAAFRDVSMNASSMGIDELNELYKKLLNKINLLERNQDVALFDSNYIKYQIEMTLVEILNYFKGVMFGKYGLQRKRLLSRNVDYGTRIVITAPSFDEDTFGKQRINIDRSGMPLSAVSANCQLFLIRRISTYLSSLPINDSSGKPFSLDDKEMYYNTQAIKDYIEIYGHSWGERLKRIKTPDENGYVQFTYIDSDGETLTRDLTITDVLYMFSYQEIELGNKHTLITRHPTMDTFNVIPNKIHVLSTVRTKTVTIDDVIYPYYPDIDYIMNKYNLDDVNDAIEASKELSGYFIESEKMSNLQLAGMNGDLDGDKTINRILFSDEANKECEDHLNKVTSIFDLSMNNVKTLGKDAAQTLYSFTAYSKKNTKLAKSEIGDLILSKKPDEITVSFLFKELRLADTSKLKKLNDIHDILEIPSARIKYNDTKESITTCTIGQLILYKLLLEDVKYPIIAEPWKPKRVDKMFNECGTKIISKTIPEEDKITLDDFKQLLNRYEGFSMRMSSFINPSIDSDLLVLSPKIIERKAKLLADNSEAIDNNDIQVYADIEDEVLDMAKDAQSNNDNAEWFDSGIVGYGNEFKTMVLSMGALPQDTSFDKFQIISNSLAEGIPKEKLMYAANSATIGGYSRGKSPEEGGAIAKATGYVCQGIKIGKYGTDCGTKNYVEMTMKPDHKDEYVGRYIVEGKENVLLTDKNIGTYINKTVLLRSPLTCKNPNICNVCAGELVYDIMGDDLPSINYGMFLSKASSEIVQKRLKLSHDSTVHFCKLDMNCVKESHKDTR